MKRNFHHRPLALAATALLLAASITSCATRPKTPTQLDRLQGAWTGALTTADPNQKITITISGNSLHFHRDTNFWFNTTFTLPSGKDPLELHATIHDCAPPRDPVGKAVTAIYKIEHDTLTLAALSDDAPETDKTFDAPGLTIYKLRKEHR